MLGAIRRRDVLAHPAVTIRCFGWKVFFRVLLADHQQTFLGLLVDCHAFDGPTQETPEIFRRCIRLEQRARRVYQSLARRFSDRDSVGAFYETLAEQEQGHAELLEVCRTLASRDGWSADQLDPWQAALPQLERQMEEAEAWSESVDGLRDALRLVIQIESSEVNHVYLAIVGATDSAFVARLDVFREAVDRHIRYLCGRISELEPELAGVCGKLLESHLAALAEA